MRWIPNAISIARILFTPYVAYLIAINDMRTALPTLFLVGISDGFDGWLARKFNWTSEFGAKLDPIGDKVLVATVFIALGYAGILPWWIVGVILGRDLLILAFAAYALAFTQIRALPPSVWGKISTALQLLLAGACVLSRALPENPLAPTVPFWRVSAVIATIWSGLHYAFTAARLFGRQNAD